MRARVLLLLLPLLAILAAPAHAASKLTLVSPAGNQPFPMDLRVGKDGGRGGLLNVVIRNGGKTGKVRVTWSASDPSSGVRPAVSLAGEGAEAKSVTDEGVVFDVKGGAVLPLVVGADVGKDQASSLDGTLVFMPREKGEPFPAEPLGVRIVGRRGDYAGITFTPSKLTLSVVTGKCHCDHGETTSVIMRGPHVNDFLDTEEVPETYLSGEDGGEVDVALSDFKPSGDGAVKASVAAIGGFHEGSYSGALRLGDEADAPKLDIVVKAHDWFWWGVLIVLAGSLLGQLLPRLLGLRRRRERLVEALVRPERAFRAADHLYKGYASYDVRALVGEGPWLRRRPKPGTRDGRIQELARRVRQARSEEDFEQVETEVEAAVADILRWIDVERATIALAKLLGAKHPNRAGQLFVDRFAYLDANELRESLKRDPGAKAAAQLLATAREERELLGLAADIWALQIKLDPVSGAFTSEERARFEATALDVVWPPEKAWGKRRGEDGPQIQAAMVRAQVELEELLEEYPPPAEKAVPAEEPVPAAHPARREGPGFGARVARWWKRHFAPWAREVPGRVWQWLREWFFGLELVTTALAFAVPAVLYMTTVYDSTWGSDEQLLAAFAAGFVGTVVINWGAVWFLQSAWTHFPKPKKPGAGGGASAQNS